MLVTIGLALSLLVQLGMIVIGFVLVFGGQDASAVQSLIVTWCSVGTLYTVGTLIVLGRLAKQEPAIGGGPARFAVSAIPRIVAMTTTVLSSMVGLIAVLELVFAIRAAPDEVLLQRSLDVWAMLLSWGLLHWGFAQIYYQRYFTLGDRPLRFPGTRNPRLIDFVYFSYTLGTTFAASDVEVRTTRMRWTVTWHCVVSFLFNGLIIVLAFQTITSAN